MVKCRSCGERFDAEKPHTCPLPLVFAYFTSGMAVWRPQLYKVCWKPHYRYVWYWPQ